MKEQFILGITGGIGAGKSTVLQYLQEKYHAVLLQCDAIGMELQQPGGACYTPIVEAFGTDILLPDGQLNRKKLADIVFSDPQKRNRLNAIVHPAVKNEVQRRIREYENRDGFRLFVVEAALLLEDHYEEICDAIWYIYADTKVRIQRLIRDRGYTEEKCLQIMAAQKDDAFYRSRCRVCIDNSSDRLQDTFEQLDAAVAELTEVGKI